MTLPPPPETIKTLDQNPFKKSLTYKTIIDLLVAYSGSKQNLIQEKLEKSDRKIRKIRQRTTQHLDNS